MRRALPLLCLGLALPGAEAATAQQIVRAQYASPVNSYGHGVLGDEGEWAALRITLSREDGSNSGLNPAVRSPRVYEVRAPADMVFEDTAPRLWDVTGDGVPEIVTVLSHRNLGARLAVIGYEKGRFRYIATTPPIGRRFRWLAPVGAADLDGDGSVELALIETPHLTKTLQIWRYRNGRLIRVAQRRGFTNHRIGWAYIAGGIRNCGKTPEIISADGDWSRIMASTLAGDRIETRVIGSYRGPESLNAALDCR